MCAYKLHNVNKRHVIINNTALSLQQPKDCHWSCSLNKATLRYLGVKIYNVGILINLGIDSQNWLCKSTLLHYTGTLFVIDLMCLSLPFMYNYCLTTIGSADVFRIKCRQT